MNAAVEPKLAPAGAGLPAFELLIGRIIFAVRRWRGDRETFDRLFRQERQRIRELAESCDAAAAGTRVLIARPRGLEDSSRNWSVWMTLDHLRIIHEGQVRIISKLSQGIVPEGKASTAAVKPSPQASGAVIAEYERSCDKFLGLVASLPDLKTKLRYAHPWFGPLDAAGWHALTAGHMSIHRIQIERILDGLTRQKESEEGRKGKP